MQWDLSQTQCQVLDGTTTRMRTTTRRMEQGEEGPNRGHRLTSPSVPTEQACHGTTTRMRMATRRMEEGGEGRNRGGRLTSPPVQTNQACRDTTTRTRMRPEERAVGVDETTAVAR
jgi:hypothetical protein